MSEFCTDCKREITRDEVGLTLKLFGTDHKDRYCKECMTKRLDCTKEYLDEMLAYFKTTDCPLFN